MPDTPRPFLPYEGGTPHPTRPAPTHSQAPCPRCTPGCPCRATPSRSGGRSA
jgi:hypothetical protein